MRWQDYLWLLLLSGSYLMFFLFSRKKRKKPKRRRADRPLTRKEQQIWHKLQDGGYRLSEIHPGRTVTMTVDGSKKQFFHEGNFIVSRGGENILVKLSRRKEPLYWPALRQELLLDALFFQVDGIFYYLETKGQLQEIRFAYPGEPGVKEQFLWKAVLVALIVVGAAFLGHLLSRSGIF